MKSNDIIMESGLFSINSLIESPEHSQLSYRTEFTFLVSCAKLSAKLLNLCLGGDPRYENIVELEKGVKVPINN